MSQPICRIKLGAPTIIATFDGQTVVHDEDGNMTSGPLNSSTPVAYAYDARNRLTGAGGLTYTYDSEGNRITLTQGGQTTSFAMNPVGGLSQLLVRTRPDGSKTYYVYGQGLLYDVETTSTGTETGVWHNYHYDYRGSTVAVSDGAGTVTERIEYSIYGQITRQTGTLLDTPFLFNGFYGVQTDGNGLYCMRARYYNPYIKRFVNADPIGLSAGLNFYAYADGNPISAIDPFGLCAENQSPSTWQSFGNGLNNTVSAIGQSMGQGLYDLSHLTWSQDQYTQIYDQMYSMATPANPAATPYIEGALGVSTAAVSVAGAAGVWELAGGSTMTVSVGPGSPFHVIYGADGEFAHAAGQLGSQTIRGISSYALPGYEATAYGQITGIPVLFPEAVTATGGSATTCVTAAMRAFLAGWGL